MTFIFTKKNWPKRDVTSFNVTSHPLVSPQKIIFPLLYIKLDKSGAFEGNISTSHGSKAEC